MFELKRQTARRQTKFPVATPTPPLERVESGTLWSYRSAGYSFSLREKGGEVEAFGYCGVRDSDVVAVNNAAEWSRIVSARAAGDAFLISCSDRFNSPPEYYWVNVPAPADLTARLEYERTKPMTEVFVVWDLSRVYEEVK